MTTVDLPIPTMRQVVIDTTDARATAEFWRQLLGLVYRRDTNRHPRDRTTSQDVTGSTSTTLLERRAFQQVPVLHPDDLAGP